MQASFMACSSSWKKHIQSITAAALPAFRAPKATNSFLHIYIKNQDLTAFSINYIKHEIIFTYYQKKELLEF